MDAAPGSPKEPLTAISNRHVRAHPRSLHGKLPPCRHWLLSNRSVTTAAAHSQPHTSALKTAGDQSGAVSEPSSDVLLVRQALPPAIDFPHRSAGGDQQMLEDGKKGT